MTYFYTCQRLARIAMGLCRLTPLLEPRAPGAIPPVWADLWHLFQLVTIHRPSVVVEFGSGFSTVIIGEALRRNGRGSLFSVETEPKWLEATQRLLAGKSLPVLTYPARAIPAEIDGVRGFVHEPRPVNDADLVYLDGPMLTGDRRVTFDPLEMSWRRLVVDNRQETVDFLKPRIQGTMRHSSLGYTTWTRKTKAS